MKPTEKQKIVAKLIQNQGEFWGRTNDINSPTHHCDIDEYINIVVFDEIITEKEAAVLETKLNDLLLFIKKLEE